MILKSSKKILLVATIITILNIQSCKRYDDGPAFSLRSVTNRLTSGDWEVVDIEGQTSMEREISFEFDKDGDFTARVEYDGFYGGSYTEVYRGEWSFEDKKKTLDLEFDDFTNLEFEIKKLSNDELWFEDEENNLWELEK